MLGSRVFRLFSTAAEQTGVIFSPAAKTLLTRNPALSSRNVIATGMSPGRHLKVVTKGDVLAALQAPVKVVEAQISVAPNSSSTELAAPSTAAANTSHSSTKSFESTPEPSLPRAQAHRTHVDVPTTQMRKIIAKRLLESKLSLPHEYMQVEVEMDQLLHLRTVFNQHSPTKASVNDFIIKAAAAALRSVPEANAYWTPDAIKFHATVDVAFAAATPAGLVTPVIRNADKKPVPMIAQETKDLAIRARANKLLPEEFTGGSVSVSNLGMYDISEFIAVLNPPQALSITSHPSQRDAVILAVGSTQTRATPDSKTGGLTKKEVLTISLSHDGRVVDGALAQRLGQTLKRLLEHPSLIFM